MRLLIGLMSGTSMDGIDAALVDVDAHLCLGALTRPFEAECKILLQKMMTCESTSPQEISQLNTLLGREFADAANSLLVETKKEAHEIIAIGSHGQTICHDAKAAIPYTMQLGCPHTIAEFTGIDVIADFRSRDLVMGGQGAPFAPIYHQALFRAFEKPLAVLNIGGISNITFLQDEEEVLGFDVGPGNCLMDAWIQSNLGFDYDARGDWAHSGLVILPLLEALLADPYFKSPPPKSLGKEYFSKSWLESHLQSSYAPQDVQATLLAFTVKTISDVLNASELKTKRVIVCGGGAHNVNLLNHLQEQCHGMAVESSALHGIDPDFVEAMMFAWMADKALKGIALDFTKITGSRHPAVYGAFYKAHSSS